MAISIAMPTLQGPPPSRDRKAPPLTVSRPELLIDGSDRDFRVSVHGLLAFAARLEAVQSGFANLLGLTGIQYTILMAVNHLKREGEVSVGRVADHLHLSGAYITIETGKLLKSGLLSKQQDPKDGRRVCLRIAGKGRRLLSTLAPTQVMVNDVLFEFLSAPQFRQLRRKVDLITTCGDRAVSLLNHLAKEPEGRRLGSRP